MTRTIGISLILAGSWLAFKGYNRSESIAGKTEAGFAHVQNKIDGGARVPEHLWYYLGGGGAILAGAWLAYRKN